MTISFKFHLACHVYAQREISGADSNLIQRDMWVQSAAVECKQFANFKLLS